MIQREYFESELPAQIGATDRSLTVTIVLRDGTLFRIRRLGRVTDDYAVFEVYPTSVPGAVRGGRASGETRVTAGPGDHYAVIPFESISHVTLAAGEPEAVEGR